MESPDGGTSIRLRRWRNRSPLWRRPVSGGVPVKVLEGVVLSNFVVREQGIYYIDRPSGPDGVLTSTSLRAGRGFVFRLRDPQVDDDGPELGNVGNFLTVSSDGRTILYVRMDSSVDDLMLVEGFR